MKSISDSVFGSSISEIILNFYIIVFSVPVAMYIFGMIYSNTEKRYSHILNEASKRNHAESMSRLPVLMVCSALIPLCLIYILFFISQIGYYIDAFQKIIPSGYTAAEYARSGFFQLCAVASINLFVILFASVFSKKNSSKQSAGDKDTKRYPFGIYSYSDCYRRPQNDFIYRIIRFHTLKGSDLLVYAPSFRDISVYYNSSV